MALTESSFQSERALNVGKELADDWLDFLVKPAAKSMNDAAADRDDWSHGPGGLVDLRHHVKVGEFIVDVEGAPEVSLVWVAYGLGMYETKQLDESRCVFYFSFSFLSRQPQAGCCI